MSTTEHYFYERVEGKQKVLVANRGSDYKPRKPGIKNMPSTKKRKTMTKRVRYDH